MRGQERKVFGHKSAEFAHDRHQLLLVVEGAVSVENNFASWTVPAGCAAWISARVRHSLVPLTASRLRTLYIWRAPAPIARQACTVLEVGPLLAALIDQVCRLEVLRADDAAAKRLAAVLIDQIGAQRELPLLVPSLRSPLTQRVAAALHADPADTPRIRDLAAGLGVGDRTIERAFLADAAMTIGEWRQRARISRAIALLAAGREVKDVALEVGYETASAFVAAFKRTVGSTPAFTFRSSRYRSAPSVRRSRQATAPAATAVPDRRPASR